MKPTFYLLLLSLPIFAATKTWTGQITENMCGADHTAMSSGSKKVDSHDCTLTCVKEGAKFAFVSDGKVFDIANQKLGDLAKHAGQDVRLTGDLGPDGKTITVSKLVAKK